VRIATTREENRSGKQKGKEKQPKRERNLVNLGA
jgi:hypothetical protein